MSDHARTWLGGLVILVFLTNSLPGTALAAPPAFSTFHLASANLPSTFTGISLYANIETVGVVVSGSNLPKVAELLVRQSGEAAWHSGHPLMRIDDGRLVGSLFELAPATSYDVKVLDGTTEISGMVVTQPDQLQFTPSATVYVSASAATGGNGSAAA